MSEFRCDENSIPDRILHSEEDLVLQDDSGALLIRSPEACLDQRDALELARILLNWAQGHRITDGLKPA